jgi:RNA polymerase sigma-70 factor (ECF subfamily)
LPIDRDEPADDDRLVRDLRRGDDRAFARLVEVHGQRLLRLARGMLGNDADADDALQQTLMGVMGSIGSFRGESSLKTWLTRILVNQASKVRRSRATRAAASLEQVLGDDRATGDAAVRGRNTDSKPAATVAARADVQTMLAALSPEHRDVLILRELEGLSYREIADALGVAQGTVESRLFRAREQMRRRFEGYQP